MDPNLQQMLSQQLRDVHLPEQAGWWPFAIGWWILIAVAVIAIITGTVALIRHRKQNRYRKQALQKLQSYYSDWQQQQDTVAYLQSVNALLKRSILHIDDASRFVKFTGQRWIDALNGFVKTPLSEQTEKALAFECYQGESNADVENVQRDVIQWLKSHQHKMRGEHA